MQTVKKGKAMLGTDIVEVNRIKGLIANPKFVTKVFTDEEIEHLNKKTAQSWAGVWAAKEAVSKALGSGLSAGVTLKDITVITLPSGQPVARLSGAALELLHKLGFENVAVSISHTAKLATAVALLER